MINRAQFIQLAGQLFDALDTGVASAVSAVFGDGRAPKFDTAISRKGGLVQWASETDLDGIRYWRRRADEPPSDPKYAESNAKQSKALSYWIAYRQAEPNATWSGERNRQSVTAKPPNAKPETYARDASPGTAATATTTPTPTNFEEEDEIPF